MPWPFAQLFPWPLESHCVAYGGVRRHKVEVRVREDQRGAWAMWRIDNRLEACEFFQISRGFSKTTYSEEVSGISREPRSSHKGYSRKGYHEGLEWETDLVETNPQATQAYSRASLYKYLRLGSISKYVNCRPFCGWFCCCLFRAK